MYIEGLFFYAVHSRFGCFTRQFHHAKGAAAHLHGRFIATMHRVKIFMAHLLLSLLQNQSHKPEVIREQLVGVICVELSGHEFVLVKSTTELECRSNVTCFASTMPLLTSSLPGQAQDMPPRCLHKVKRCRHKLNSCNINYKALRTT